MRAGAGAFYPKPSHDPREKKMTKERSETLLELVAELVSQLALPDFPKTERADGVKKSATSLGRIAAEALEVQGERSGERGS